MDRSEDGLSDVLHQMASDAEARLAKPTSAGDQDHFVEGSTEGDAVLPTTGSRSARPTDRTRTSGGSAQPQRPGQRRGTGGHDRIKAIAVPVLGLVGLLLLIPAMWSLLLLADHEVWHHDRQGARSMATVMLICWPIAAALVGTAGFYGYQLLKGPEGQKKARRG